MSWLQKLFAPRKSATIRRNRPTVKPALEMLEHRLAPASYALDPTNHILSLELADGESLTVTESAGTATFLLSGSNTWVNGGSTDVPAADGTATLQVATADLASTLQINAQGANAGTNNVTFSGSGSIASSQILVSLVGPNSNSNIELSGGFSLSATGSIELDAFQNITVGAGSELSTSGSGTISLSANQGSTPTTGNFVGIDINGGTIEIAGTGQIQLDGKGGTTGSNNVGIEVQGGGKVASTASGADAGTIVLDGTGGSGGTTANNGVVLTDSGTLVTAVDGSIQITGQGGAGTSSTNHGVVAASSAVVSSTGTDSAAATITLNGTGGAGTSDNLGVLITLAGTQVTSVDGAIQITGQGGAGSGADNDGLVVADGGVVTSTGTGAAAATITLAGTGGGASGTDGNNGADLQNTGTMVGSVDGAIQITGTVGTGNGDSVELLSSGDVTVTGVAPVTIIGDAVFFGHGVTNVIVAAGSTVTLRAQTDADEIDLGASYSSGVFGLTATELTAIEAGTIQIGYAQTNEIVVSAALSLSTNLVLEAETIDVQADIDTTNGNQQFIAGAINMQDGSQALTVGSGTAEFDNADLTLNTSTLTVTGGLVFNSNLTYEPQFSGTTPGTGYDQIVATAGVSLNGASLDPTFNFTPPVGQSFTLIHNESGSPVSGTFYGLPEGSIFDGEGVPMEITYQGGTGNDVVLTVLAAPPTSIVVDNTGDVSDGNFSAGHLTLREAIGLANALPDANTITFDPTVFGTPQTITLAGTELPIISADVTITGPGANLLTIDANQHSRIFEIANGVTATLSGLTLTGGMAADGGGGILDNGLSLTVEECVITANSAGEDGGGINSGRGLYVIDSTIAGNSAGDSGGGIVAVTGDIINSTIAGNSTVGIGGGVLTNGPMTFRDDTIVGNTANTANGTTFEPGGGIYLIESGVDLFNTIVAGNLDGTTSPTAADIGGYNPVGSGAFDLIGDPSSAGGLVDKFYDPSQANLVGVNGNGVRAIATILDTTLQNNGGTTPTLALVANSAAIDAGQNARALDPNGDALTTDQRGTGFNRIVGTVDIGAFEVQPALVQFSTASETVGEDAGTFSITVTLSAVSGTDTSIPFTVGGTAVAGIDCSGVSASPLVIPAGQTTGTITGTIVNHGVFGGSADKTLTFTLSTPTGATLGTPASNTLTISPVTTRPNLPGLTTQERYVQALYIDELGRQGSTAELDAWVAVLHGPGGEAAVIAGIENSAEGTDHLVKSWYEQFLGREPSDGEEQGWDAKLLGGATEESVLAGILGGSEFYNRAQTLVATGTSDVRFVQALFQVLLNRSASDSEVSYWLGELSTEGQQGVVLGILDSSEYRTDTITGYYDALLHRTPDQVGLTYWVNSGLDLGAIRKDFENGVEFTSNG